MLEPIRLPIEIPGCFLNAATLEATSSGKEVPKATIVEPTTAYEIPRTSIAIISALETRILAPKYRPTDPEMK